MAALHPFAVRMAVFYGAAFLIVGTHMPFLPVWLSWRGLDEEQIAIAFAAPLVARALFTPAVSFAADRIGHRTLLIRTMAWGSLMALALLPFAGSFTAILAALVMFSLFWTTVMPLTETVAMAGVRSTGLDYGRMRLWGSLSFVAATAGGGLVLGAWGDRAALWLVMGAAVSVALASFVLPGDGHDVVRRASLMQTPETGMAGRISLSDMWALARLPVFWLFLAATSAVQAAHAVYYTFGTLHWQALGLPGGVIGALWATGVIAEVVLFAWSRPVVARFGPARLILWAGLAAMLRWTAMTADPPLAVLFPLQALHAFTFGAAHLGAIHFIARAFAERHAATAQGLYAAVTAGIAMGAATYAAGPLYRALGSHAFAVMAGLGAVSVLAALALIRRWDGDLLTSPPKLRGRRPDQGASIV